MMTPSTEAELSEFIKSATGPLAIQGGGTRGFAPKGEPVSLSSMSGITLYEPGALTISAKAGTPVAEIEAALDAEKQMLAFEPMDHRPLLGTSGEPTIGGVVAANISGPRRVQAGACRDFLLGVRFVTGEGQIVKNGGRVMKNVTGYDLARLVCGSHGTLGAITEVSLKVLPKPEFTCTLVLDDLGLAQTNEAMTKAMNSPFDVTGAGRLPDGRTILRLEGFEDSVCYRAKSLADQLGGRQETDPAANAQIWQSLRDVVPLADKSGDVWKISAKPSDLVAVSELGHADDMLVDWAGGLVWMALPQGTDLHGKIAGIGGHAKLAKTADSGAIRFQPEPPALAELAKAMRSKYDPNGILNPGLMG